MNEFIIFFEKKTCVAWMIVNDKKGLCKDRLAKNPEVRQEYKSEVLKTYP